MNLRDRNTRFALLKAMRDAIDEELTLERADHTDLLRAQYDEVGVKSFDVKLPGGGKVGTISLSVPKADTIVRDEEALLAWCRENMPSAVIEERVPAQPEVVIPATPARTVYRVDDAMVTALLKGSRPVDPTSGGLVVDDDGVVIEGVEYVPAGRPKSFAVRYERDGREALALAYRAGELDHLLGGSTLPMLEGHAAVALPDLPESAYAEDAVDLPEPEVVTVDAAIDALLADDAEPLVWEGEGA